MGEGNQVVDYLDDGYTETATIGAAEGVHNALTITYRPCLQAERLRVFDALDKSGSEASHLVSTDLIASHVQKWDKVDRKGAAVPVSKANVAKLRPELFNKLADVVIYGKLPDGTKLDVEADLKNSQSA